MQVPIRRAEKIARPKSDPHLTPEKFRELKYRLEKLKTVSRPRESQEVQRLALMGDFSENAGYQLAKSRLRGINNRILEIEDLLKRAEIIEPNNNKDIVGLGHAVTLEIAGREKVYRILGSAETNPTGGVISHNSPLGAALIGRRKGETISLEVNGQTINYLIKDIT